jgi:DNA repair exonuclease SbcCD nuclease subunit
MALRFAHTADVHLDSPLALRDLELADLIGRVTRKAFHEALE